MELEELNINYKTGETGELELVVFHNGKQYTLMFDFEDHPNFLNQHSVFPTSNKMTFAWPQNPIPQELKHSIPEDGPVPIEYGPQLPSDINLLTGPYESVENENRSPFIDYPD